MWKWILKTFEDDKGNPDHKRITGFAFCVLIAFMVFFDKLNSFIQLYAFLGLIVAVLVLYQIVKAQDIVQFRQGYNSNKNNEGYQPSKNENPNPPGANIKE